MTRAFHYGASLALMAALTGCMVGPKYSRPTTPLPAEGVYKEALASGMRPAQPRDDAAKGKWWETYQDPALSALEEQISLSNQNVHLAEAQFREAREAVRAARSALWPSITAGLSFSEVRSGGLGAGTSAGIYDLSFGVSWEPDLWGNLRRGVTAARASAQASAGDLENVRLLYQSELAADYYQIRGIDNKMDLLQKTDASYSDYVTLTRNRYQAGVASPLDVNQAESQLYGVEAALTDLGAERAQLEHAIAVLTGKPPADVTIAPQTAHLSPPEVPAGLPAELLERRPDIAAAERRIASANEQIGIAMAAFYPVVTLGGSAGFQSTHFEKWFELPSRFWSVGPSLSETLFDAGRRKAIVAEQRAVYDSTVAGYRQTVLTAFQQVEDSLAALRVYQQEAEKIQATVRAADAALTVSSIQYKAGTTNYLTVLTAQVTLLNAQVTAVDLETRRMVASVQLIQALGGGWESSQLKALGDSL